MKLLTLFNISFLTLFVSTSFYCIGSLVYSFKAGTAQNEAHFILSCLSMLCLVLALIYNKFKQQLVFQNPNIVILVLTSITVAIYILSLILILTHFILFLFIIILISLVAGVGTCVVLLNKPFEYEILS